MEAQQQRFRPIAVKHLEPPARISSARWLEYNVTMPPGTETGGMPFSVAAFPHVDGPLAAFDDPNIRRIILQWGTRLGKTTLCLSLASFVAGHCPRNMMIAGSTKDAISRVIGSRLYPILDSTDGVRSQLLPESRRSRLDVRLEACRIFVGWSGSDTSLADVGAWFGVANEVDKWDESASSEADSLPLFLNRFKGFTNHKIILESTPTIRGKSRVERELQASNIHRRYVPCPHCNAFQVLRKGEMDSPGGFRWDHDSNGKSEPEIAYQTAWYECEKCRGKIENHHRVPMLRAGVWVPDGCSVDDSGNLSGKADRGLSDTAGFGPLPSWYALTETWGSFARQWVRALKRPRELQDVVNSYMAETWEVRRTKTTPERVAERITGGVKRGIVPIGGRFLTVTCDRQAADGGFVLWVVVAHGDDDRAWLIDWNMSLTLEETWQPVMRGTYPHEDGGQSMTPVAAGVDSGWNTKDTYDFCNRHPGVIPIKGSNTDLAGRAFKLARLSDVHNDGQMLLHVNTDYWETDLQSRLDDRLANEPGSLTLAHEAKRDAELIEQLCNATISDSVDNRGNAKMLWKKKDENVPNDFRDAIRYGLCLGRAWLEENGGQMPPRMAINTRERVIVNSGDRRPDGRAWNE